MQVEDTPTQHAERNLDVFLRICLSIYHANIKTEYTMTVKSLSELETLRGGAALKARLKHVDDRLKWFGYLRLADHASKFGISEVQAKIDIKTYRYLSPTPPPERKPGPAAGSLGAGAYLRPEKFAPVFDVPASMDDLWATRFPEARTDEPLSLEVLSAPEHRIEPDDVRALLAATELRTSCRLRYQSMTSAEASERIVCPHAVVKASGRYHVRAFDFSRKRFIDFSLPRVLSSDLLPDHAPVPATLDDDWHKTVEVEFVAHPRLSPAQRSTIAREYGMQQGASVITVRRAMLFYLLDEMRLLKAIRQQDKDLADVPVWVKNSKYVADELASMESET
ncbi:hypothetical protein XH99_28875 [Bradyrhizobium nanningense]|uniref:Uncharacterized protein n=1 Tax=Bradyrhizobium nanningense TaxID=1325118 RepID=A0A4Q0RZ11_9BRAD|nr:WYL domain-containing protein [Bradyrhizobium nanningense]RXH24105.1 hypothetical protein XH99_28875 [Bradyrhizobium nanningense]RXH29340.1 hypothetical protein XH84_22925 [Bradyrhizobium nanningense]